MTPDSRNAAKSVLSSDLRINGDIFSDGAVEILGKVEGNITARALMIGVDGTLNGMVTADVIYQSVVIEDGAALQGRFTLDKP